MGYVGTVAALVGVVVAVLAGLLASVDLSASPGGEGGAAMGSGAMFDAIAGNYDLVNKVISLGGDVAWRRELVAALELQAGHRVLDLATGTADVAIMLGREPEAPVVVGVDPSNNMLEIGRQKVRDAGLGATVELFQGDAQALTGYGDSSFDSVSMSFGIRNGECGQCGA